MRDQERRSAGAKQEGAPRRACCLVSEILEEAGLDRETARKLRRQVLEGIVLLCQWQLERMEKPSKRGASKATRVAVE
jgi:hypothetical protein